jgi:RNA recognition motif-containing protein
MIMNGTAYDRSELENGHDLADTGKQPDADHIKMFVGQLPRTFTEEDCRKVFEEFGPIHSINILRDKVSGQGKGKQTFFSSRQGLFKKNISSHVLRTLENHEKQQWSNQSINQSTD